LVAEAAVVPAPVVLQATVPLQWINFRASKFILCVLTERKNTTVLTRCSFPGAKVLLIERGASWDNNGIRRGAGFGGTCVNVGCSKQ